MNFVFKKFNITNDPCPSEPEVDGLKEDWAGLSFVHPPYSETEAWVKKAVQQARKGHFSVCFVPFLPNSLYWREFVFDIVSEIIVLKCPVKLENEKKQLTNQMCLLIFAAAQDREESSIPVTFEEPEDWQSTYYKRQRNQERFAPK